MVCLYSSLTEEFSWALQAAELIDTGSRLYLPFLWSQHPPSQNR